jgi:signal transduction histidine kinase
VNEITTVLEIISSISSPLTLDETLAEFTEKTTQLVGADGCTIFQCQPETDTMVVLAHYMSPEIETPFGEVSHVGASYPLARYPAIAQALGEQTPLIIYSDDPKTDEAEKGLLNALHWQGVLMTPMLSKRQTVGLLNLYVDDKRHHQFSDNDVSLCQALANHAAILIENAQLYQEVEEGQLIAEAMQVIGRALASELDYQRIVRNVADFAYRLVDAQFVYVAVPENESFRLVAKAGRDRQNSSPVPSTDILSKFLDQAPLTQAVHEKRPIVVADIKRDPALTPWQKEAEIQGWRAMVAIPLLSRNQLVGVLAAYASQPSSFSSNDVATLMSLASQAAVAIQNAQLFAELEAQHQALHQVSLRLVNAQEEERRRISRELHDELGQALTALKINLDVARRLLPVDASSKLRQSIHEASSLAVQTLETARNLSLELHPAMLDDLGLVSALRWEVDRYEQRTGQSVHFKADVDEVVLRSELEITIYRIVTEALTNVARHARADVVSVSLGIADHQVVIEIEDNGVGFDATKWFSSPAERQSLGLVGMRERAELLGGQLEVISAPGCGTKIWVQLPIGD